MQPAAGNLRNPADIPDPIEEQVDRQPKLYSGFFDQDDRYQTFRRRGTETWLAFFTVSGQGFMRGQSGAVTLTCPGDLHVYRPDVWNHYGTVPGTRWGFHWIHFQPRPTWAGWLRLKPVASIDGLVHASVDSEEVKRRVADTFDRIHRDTAIGTVWRVELAMNALERVLLLIGEVSGLGRKPLDSRVQEALERIATTPADDHSIDKLAQRVSLSPSRFAHLFKAETGQSPQRFITETRLNEAAKLIGGTAMSVTEVAETVGYRSTFHFSTSFRRQFDMSPRDYRNQRRRAV